MAIRAFWEKSVGSDPLENNLEFRITDSIENVSKNHKNKKEKNIIQEENNDLNMAEGDAGLPSQDEENELEN